MDSISPFEDKTYRRGKWYFGTDEEKIWEAKKRKREWISMIQKRMPSNYRPSVMEVGVWEGEHAWIIYHCLAPSALFLVDAFKDMNKHVGIYSADDEDAYNWVREIFKNAPEVEVIKNTSVNAAKMFQDKSIDYIYIDAAHDHDNALIDMNAWWPKVTDIGALCGHDAGSEGVFGALTEFNKPGLEISPNGTEWVIPKIVG